MGVADGQTPQSVHSPVEKEKKEQGNESETSVRPQRPVRERVKNTGTFEGLQIYVCQTKVVGVCFNFIWCCVRLIGTREEDVEFRVE